MAKRGKTIELYLIDGEGDGRIRVDFKTWVGLAYKVPKDKSSECQGQADYEANGVYLMFGTNPADGTKSVYVGQAGVRKNGKGLMSRVMEPHKTIDYWEEAVLLTTKNDSFGPTEISFLESRLYNIALSCNQYNVTNSAAPTSGNLSKSKEDELEDYIDGVKIVVGSLGYKVFVPSESDIVKSNDEGIELILSEKGLIAKAIYNGETILVKTGSQVAATTAPSFQTRGKNYYVLRQNLIDQKIIVNGVFVKDYEFQASSAAAAIICGGNRNGKTSWKLEDGRTLKEYLGE